MLARQTIAGRTGHAVLITGAPGVGKTTLALRLAQAINCTGAQPPCMQCRACDLIERGLHPDIQIIEADGRTIRIEAIRDLQHDLMLRPIEARNRIAIIRNMTDATGQAQDALLKTLEEPAPTSRLILTAQAAELLLPTITSRCRIVPLRPVPADVIAEGLQTQFNVLAENASLLARLSGGRPGWAINAAHAPEVLETRHAFIDELAAMLRADRIERFAYCDQITRNEDLDLMLITWQSWWRDVLLLVEGSAVQPVNVDRIDDLQMVAAAISPADVRRSLRAMRRTITARRMYANTRLTLEVLMLDLPYL